MSEGAAQFETLSSGSDVDDACSHADARRIRLHLQYAEANVVRVRYAELVDARVGPLRRVNGAWSFRVCRACGALSRARAA
ncbi:MAG TPA: hypothetical protein VNN07_13955 [Candidatus Tectomicrobia bacterium]|nr:hypothetical protein [Candidatus Tectomicrobia bacterium]